MRLTWLSNAPWSPTGYGNQTKVFLPRLKQKGHEPACIAFYGLEGAPLQWAGMTIYPKRFNPYGLDVADAHSVHHRSDLLISLLDAWVINPETVGKHVPWAPWFPVDSEPLPQIIRDVVAKASFRIVFSRFGEQMVKDAGLDCYYVPHGVDTKAFHPIDQSEARKALGWPEDAFIVGMVAANKGNPSRKAFAPQIEAFAELKKMHSDAVLYLHTYRSESGEYDGVNLPELIESLGLIVGEDVLFPDQYTYSAVGGFPDDHMAKLYSAMDVHMLVSMGEGFGIPTLEAQACGTPVIGGNWTATEELIFSGWAVPKSEADRWWTPLATYQYQPRVGGILNALESAYEARGDVSYREAAREKALEYDADLITEKYWMPVLADIEQRLADQKAVKEAVAKQVEAVHG